MKNCFVYCRRSSEDQCRQVQSVKDQKSLMTQIAKDHGLHIEEIFVDEKSAGKPYQRPAFQAMMEAINNGKADIIVTWKIDRLSRNPVENGQVSWLLQQGIIKEIITSDRTYLPTDNVLPLLVEGAMANQYIRDLSNNVKRGQQSKLERGLYPACAPFGYKNFGKYKGDKYIDKDPDVEPYLQALWDLAKTKQYQISELFTLMNKKYPLTIKGKVIARSTFYKIFHNPFYSGIFKWAGEYHKGSHPIYIRKTEFDELQKFFNTKDQTRERSLEFDLKGLFSCGNCGSCITPERKTKTIKSKGGLEQDYVYYKCAHNRVNHPCSEKQLSEKKIEKLIVSEVQKSFLPKEVLEFGIEILQKRDESFDKGEKALIETKKKQIKDMNVLIQDFRERLVMETDVEIRTMMKEKYDKLLIDVVRLEEDIEMLKEDLDKNHIDLSNTLEVLMEAEKVVLSGTKEQKQSVVKSVGANWTLKDRKLDYEPSFVCQAIVKVKKSLSREKNIFELNQASDTAKKLTSDEISLIWRRVSVTYPLPCFYFSKQGVECYKCYAVSNLKLSRTKMRFLNIYSLF